jgi:hypothetical protein
MITVLENKDFIEGVFTTRTEADEYFSKHPDKNMCRIIELPSGKYPVFVTESKRGRFNYFMEKSGLIAYLKALNTGELEKVRTVSICINGGESETIETYGPSITVYYIDKPYRSKKVNEDSMGIIWHDHLDPDRLNKIIRTNSLKTMGMEQSIPEKIYHRLQSLMSR